MDLEVLLVALYVAVGPSLIYAQCIYTIFLPPLHESQAGIPMIQRIWPWPGDPLFPLSSFLF